MFGQTMKMIINNMPSTDKVFVRTTVVMLHLQRQTLQRSAFNRHQVSSVHLTANRVLVHPFWDISDYINRSLEDSEKFEVLKKDWSPKPGTTFPLSQFGQKKRSFQQQWLAEYPGLVYSAKTDGILCIFCSCHGRALDVVRAMGEVSTVADTLSNLRENVDSYSGELYSAAERLAESVGVEPSVPRLCGRQTKRANTPSTNPQEYYKRSLVIPFMDHLNQQMKDRFCELNKKGTMGLHLLPPVDESVTSETLSYFEDDLPSPATLNQEVEIWRRKWTGHHSPPATLQEALKACNGQLYPNIRTVLKITATFPVTSCECERSISTLGLVKTMLRATMGQDRLTGLHTLYFYRAVFVEQT